jgi:hypothetical protein
MGSRTVRGFLALAAGVACADGGDTPRGSGRPLPPPLGACIDALEGEQPPRSTGVEGRVEEVGLGLPSAGATDGCPLRSALRFGPPDFGGGALLAQTSWLRIRDAAEQETVVSALAEGFVFPLVAGDIVRARIDVEPIGFGVEANAFEARRADGALLFWLGSAPRLVDLEPPSEVGLSTGAVEAEIEDDCVGSYRIRSLSVSVDGTTASVPSGARVEVGRWMVVNAVTQEQTGMTACPDAFADRARVALWTLEGQVPEFGGMGGPCYPEVPLEQADGAPQYRCSPDGTLTRECSASAPCPGVSACVAGFCRASAD